MIYLIDIIFGRIKVWKGNVRRKPRYNVSLVTLLLLTTDDIRGTLYVYNIPGIMGRGLLERSVLTIGSCQCECDWVRKSTGIRYQLSQTGRTDSWQVSASTGLENSAVKTSGSIFAISPTKATLLRSHKNGCYLSDNRFGSYKNSCSETLALRCYAYDIGWGITVHIIYLDYYLKCFI